jgi:DNA-binding transcriptional regulator YhcF (GntR family)
VPIKNYEGPQRLVNVRAVNRFRAADVASLLRRRIQWGIHLGLVKSGDRLPSLRAAAAEFGVDQRSVLAAYRELEKEGIVEMRPRSGIYVAGDSHVQETLAPAARWMSEMFLQGFSRGVPPVALGSTLSGAVSGALNAACVECNADHILWMAAQLRQEFGLSTSWIECGTFENEATIERLRAADMIVTTSFHAAEARKIGEQYGLPVVVVTVGGEAPALRAELGRGPVYIVCSDARYARKLLDASDSARWMANSRPVLLDKFAAESIPEGAPLAVTKAVAEILGDDVPRGAIVMDYPFSVETRGELIAIMLSAYLRANEAKSTASADRQPR